MKVLVHKIHSQSTPHVPKAVCSPKSNKYVRSYAVSWYEVNCIGCLKRKPLIKPIGG